MSSWAFECGFALNNDFVMGEVFVGATRTELVDAMAAFFGAPRSAILAAETRGAWLVEDGEVRAFYAVAPFVRVSRSST